MANFPGRSGRRRRVLNEEVLSASASHLALRAEPPGHATEGRYSEQAAVDNHPHISDFIPRRHRTIAMLLLAGMATTGIAAALHQLAGPLTAAIGTANNASMNIIAGNSFAAWTGSIVLFVASLTCGLIYSIRKHRIDDYRGRYRIWRWSAAACLLASVNCVTGTHSLLADALSHFVGWTALQGGAIWWLVLAGVPLSWVVMRTMLDLQECRAAGVLLVSTTIAYSTAVASFLGWIPGVDATLEPLVTGGAGLLGHWLILATAASYARHVVLDAQGLIANRRIAQRESTSRKSSSRTSEDESVSHDAEQSRKSRPATLRIADTTSVLTRSSVIPAKTQAQPDDWVDGTRRERDRYEADEDTDEVEDSGDRKFSKTERKQLRKLKARNRAA